MSSIKRKGHWLVFLPVLIPAIPTAIILYGIIRFRIRHGECLPEEGCMDEASGPFVVGCIVTFVVFAVCLAAMLFWRYLDARAQAKPGDVDILPETGSAFRRYVLPALALTVIGTVTAGVVTALMAMLHEVFVKLLLQIASVEFEPIITRIAFMIPVVLIYRAIERSTWPGFAKETSFMAAFGAFAFTIGMQFQHETLIFYGAMAGVTMLATIYLMKSRKPWPYYYALAAVAVLAFVLMYMMA